MTPSKKTIAAVRFGLGFAPGKPEPRTPDELLAAVRGPDVMQAAYHGPPLSERIEMLHAFTKARNQARKGGGDDARDAFRRLRRKRMALIADDVRNVFLRGIDSPTPFRERLAFFWADHFTVAPKTQIGRTTWGDYIESAIRPHVGGRFEDMLIAVVHHPNMLLYLDQRDSFGPNSPLGKRRRKGLNENLAREILELHTLGVHGSYTQKDVRELAELLTGLTVTKQGPAFLPKAAEPGAEEVLGRRYGGARQASVAEIEAFLRDVARHPDTARHIATKLAVHFVADEPDPGLVAAMEAAYLESGGDLPTVYSAMLNHPAAWAPPGLKVRQPLDYMIAALRALGVRAEKLAALPFRQAQRALAVPLAAMGQPLLRAPGPNGWPEEAEAWITPQGLAARLQFALLASQRYGGARDPREFVEFALRDLAGESLRRAVAGAEQKAEGLTLVLASPEFNRR